LAEKFDLGAGTAAIAAFEDDEVVEYFREHGNRLLRFGEKFKAGYLILHGNR